MWESDWLQILGSGRFFKQRQMGGSDVVKYLSVRPWRGSGHSRFCFALNVDVGSCLESFVSQPHPH